MDILKAAIEKLEEKKSTDFEVLRLIKLIKICYYMAGTQNQTMGDAITNFLCIEECLAWLGMTVRQNALSYEDLQC